MKLEKNSLGGVNDMNEPALERARNTDLVTLPQAVRGTNCYNCKWISDARQPGHAKCHNKLVDQDVNGRMCCVLWSAKGEYRPFKKKPNFT